MLLSPGNRQSLGFETLTVTTATGITSSVILSGNQAARYIIIGPIETVSVRVRFDATDPTTSVGHLWPVGTVWELEGVHAIADFRIIATSGTATVPVTAFF